MQTGAGIAGSQRIGVSNLKASYHNLVTRYQEQLVSHSLTSQPLMRGEFYNRNGVNKKKFRILFVGRAVNGWEIDFRSGSVDELIDQIFASGVNVEDVSKGKLETGYNYNRSPFFQLCHAILSELSLKEDWEKRFAWTNLYKLAPYKGGNPNNTLIGDTIDDCATILRKEISFCRPTHIVLITDIWWYQPHGFARSRMPIHETAFSDMLGINLFAEPEGTIVGSGVSSSFWFAPKVVITKRPESAKIPRLEQAKQIIDAFSKL